MSAHQHLSSAQFTGSPESLTSGDIKAIRQTTHQVRTDEGAGGQCGWVSEILANQHGWGHYGGHYFAKDGRPIGDHQWNVHEPSGTIIDATADQHGEGHDVRIVRPSDPDHSRYRHADSEEQEEQWFAQERETRDREGDYWWAGGVNAPHVKRYRARERKYDGGAQDSFRT